jgi:hypothetical protein
MKVIYIVLRSLGGLVMFLGFGLLVVGVVIGYGGLVVKLFAERKL